MIKDKDIISYYYHGWELSQDGKPFPDWFYNEKYKSACLMGYMDCDLGVTKEEGEILDEIRKCE